MAFLKMRNPRTSSLREVCLLKKIDHINRKSIKKNFFDKKFFAKKNAGRNNSGRITVFTRGSGHKKVFKHFIVRTPILQGIVESIEYDAYRTASIARIYSNFDKRHFYVLAPLGLKRGHYISSQFSTLKEVSYSPGNSFFLSKLPIGSLIYNIPFFSNKRKKKYAVQAAGCSGIIITRTAKYCKIRLPSGCLKLFSANSIVSLGSLSNPLHKKIILGKAGRSRWLRKKPSVRGVAMNPIDHPHGGGQGKTSGGRPSCTPWGKLTRGQPTKKNIYNDKSFKLERSFF